MQLALSQMLNLFFGTPPLRAVASVPGSRTRPGQFLPTSSPPIRPRMLLFPFSSGKIKKDCLHLEDVDIFQLLLLRPEALGLKALAIQNQSRAPTILSQRVRLQDRRLSRPPREPPIVRAKMVSQPNQILLHFPFHRKKRVPSIAAIRDGRDQRKG